MRGDSIRDLYAKTLALLGLGVLAGAGALVDYWPSLAMDFPAADPVLVRPAVARSLPEPSLVDVRVLAESRAPRATEPWTVQTLVTTSAPEWMSLEVIDAPTFSAGQPIALNAPTTTELMPLPMLASFGEEVLLSRPVEPVATLALLTENAAPTTDGDRGWFITNAPKRIGSTIARGGAKTGASVVDAFRKVKSFVSRVLPD